MKRLIIILVVLTLSQFCFAEIPPKLKDLCPAIPGLKEQAKESDIFNDLLSKLESYCSLVGKTAFRGHSSIKLGIIKGVVCADEKDLVETEPPTYANQFEATHRSNPLAPTQYDCWFYIIKSEDRQNPFLIPQISITYKSNPK